MSSGAEAQQSGGTAAGRIQWLSDLVRLEIVLWDRIDARLKREHKLPLTFFEALYFISQVHAGSLRVGDLARALRITVGATSKLADRIARAGLLRREPDAADGRASRLALTTDGARILAEASRSYEAELAAALDAVLSADEQQGMHRLVTRLLAATHERGTADNAR